MLQATWNAALAGRRRAVLRRCVGIAGAAMALACGAAGLPSDQRIYPAISVNVDGDTCRPAAYPAQLPSAYEVIDSAKLRTALANRPGGDQETLVAVRFDPEGQAERVALLAGAEDSSALRGIESAVSASLRPQQPQPTWGVRLRFRAGGTIGATAERSQFCPPMMAGPPLFIGPGIVMPRDLAELKGAGPFRFRVLIDTDGRVRRAELLESSKNVSQDRLVLYSARNGIYHPALLDGKPIAVWREVQSRRQ